MREGFTIVDTISIASSARTIKTFQKNGRNINIGETAHIEDPTYNIPENFLTTQNKTPKQLAKQHSTSSGKISLIVDSPKTYANIQSYYGYLISIKFLNKDQITNYLVLVGLFHTLNQPTNDDMNKNKEKIATKAIKLANEIKPIKTNNLMSFKDLPNRLTRDFCETIFIEYAAPSTILTPVDYTDRDFSMSFYNSLFIQMNKSNQINQTNINKVCGDFLQLISKNSLFESVINFYNTNIGFQPTTQYEVAEFLKMLIGRCADIVYEKTKDKLDEKDKFSRIGKFPQNECFTALSSIGFEIVLYIDLEKYKCIRIYKPNNCSKKPFELYFHLNKNGIFSCVS